MGWFGRCVLMGSLVLAVSVGWLFNVNIPEGFSDPQALRLEFAIFEAFKIYGYVTTALYGFHESVKMNREFIGQLSTETNTEGLQIHDTTFDGVGVRIYVPENGVVSDAAIMNIHGGGWMYGDLESTVHSSMVDLAKRMKVTVISVDYRLAPEHPYPVPFQDCLKVTEYFLVHADEYGVNPDRVALMGDSAGGNLVAAVSLALRDKEFEWMPKLQLMFYPVLQAIDFMTPSMQRNAYDSLVHKRGLAVAVSAYAFGNPDLWLAINENRHTSPLVKHQLSKTSLDHKNIPQELISKVYIEPDMDFGNVSMWQEIEDIFMDPYFAPLMAEDLTGLPQAYLMTVEQDILRDDGIWYSQRLRSSGNKLTHVHYKNSYHGIMSFCHYKECRDAWEHVYQYLEEEL